MIHFISKSTLFNCTCIIKLFKRSYVQEQQKSENTIHPYKEIHHWNSVTEFSEYLLTNIIYNEGKGTLFYIEFTDFKIKICVIDGLVAINKPYGIKRLRSEHYPVNIANAVNYSLEDAAPYISEQLKYPNLNVIKSPEMYMSGVALFTASPNIEKAVIASIFQTQNLSNIYWAITTGIPTNLGANHELGLKIVEDVYTNRKQACIVTSWTKNDIKMQRVRKLNVKFEVLSKSIFDLCSLVQIIPNTVKNHAIRLYASTYLYTPILGDNLFASRIQKVGNTYIKLNPFFSCTNRNQNLDERIYKLLNISPSQENLIPTHIHLKTVVLRKFFGKTVTIEAPLVPSFAWTCKQLDISYENVSPI